MKGHDALARALLLWKGCLLYIQEKQLIILTSGFFIVFITSIFGLYQLSLLSTLTSESEKQADFTITDENDDSSTIVVDIQGAVEKPGIYELPEETRLIELLQKASGLNSKADTYIVAKSFNLSKKITDEEKIYIPFIEERQNNTYSTVNQEKISINSATKTQLELLPSVGEVIAQKIIDNRPFSHIDELVSKKVLGEKTFEKLKELISL